MIALLEGAPGNGKSFTAVCEGLKALDGGKYLVTNIDFVPDWEGEAARSNVLRRLIPGGVGAAERRYAERYFAAGDLATLMRVRLPNCERCTNCKRGKVCRTEGRGLLLLDECHNWMNARTWTGDDRLNIVRWLSQHRKLGFDVILIAQDSKMIDNQVRSLAEVRITLRNLKRWRPWGLAVVPFNCFIAIWRWEGGNRDVMRRQYYRLNKRVARLYDTMATSHGESLVPDDAILPPFDRPRVDAEDGTATTADEAEADGRASLRARPAVDGEEDGGAGLEAVATLALVDPSSEPPKGSGGALGASDDAIRAGRP